EYMGDLAVGPEVSVAFNMVGLGIECSVELPFRSRHGAQNEVANAASDGLEVRALELPGRPGVDAQQHGVVVEHDLKVRHQPIGISGVAMKTAAELIADAAAGHHL